MVKAVDYESLEWHGVSVALSVSLIYHFRCKQRDPLAPMLIHPIQVETVASVTHFHLTFTSPRKDVNPSHQEYQQEDQRIEDPPPLQTILLFVVQHTHLIHTRVDAFIPSLYAMYTLVLNKISLCC